MTARSGCEATTVWQGRTVRCRRQAPLPHSDHFGDHGLTAFGTVAWSSTSDEASDDANLENGDDDFKVGGKPLHGWSCDCDECQAHDERGEPRPGETGSTARDIQFTCPGRTMPQPKGAPWEGYVACYLAGHSCPPKVGLTTEGDTHRTTTWRCPCCGDHGATYCRPKEWDCAS